MRIKLLLIALALSVVANGFLAWKWRVDRKLLASFAKANVEFVQENIRLHKEQTEVEEAVARLREQVVAHDAQVNTEAVRLQQAAAELANSMAESQRTLDELRTSRTLVVNGRTYLDAAIISQTPLAVTIRHAGGLTSVPKTKLPEELRAKYSVDEAKAQADAARRAQATAAKDTQKQAQLAREQAEAEARAAEEAAALAARTYEVTYTVSSRYVPVLVDYNLDTGPKRERTMPGSTDWTVTFTAQHGQLLRLDATQDGGNFLSDATLSIKVDGVEVRRATITGVDKLQMAWWLKDGEQPEIVKYDTRNGPPKSVVENGGRRWTYKSAGFVGKTREEREADRAANESKPEARVTFQTSGFKWGNNGETGPKLVNP